MMIYDSLESMEDIAKAVRKNGCCYVQVKNLRNAIGNIRLGRNVRGRIKYRLDRLEIAIASDSTLERHGEFVFLYDCSARSPITRLIELVALLKRKQITIRGGDADVLHTVAKVLNKLA